MSSRKTISKDSRVENISFTLVSKLPAEAKARGAMECTKIRTMKRRLKFSSLSREVSDRNHVLEKSCAKDFLRQLFITLKTSLTKSYLESS